jgi:hypothetical protein
MKATFQQTYKENQEKVIESRKKVWKGVQRSYETCQDGFCSVLKSTLQPDF